MFEVLLGKSAILKESASVIFKENSRGIGLEKAIITKQLNLKSVFVRLQSFSPLRFLY